MTSRTVQKPNFFLSIFLIQSDDDFAKKTLILQLDNNLILNFEINFLKKFILTLISN